MHTYKYTLTAVIMSKVNIGLLRYKKKKKKKKKKPDFTQNIMQVHWFLAHMQYLVDRATPRVMRCIGPILVRTEIE